MLTAPADWFDARSTRLRIVLARTGALIAIADIASTPSTRRRGLLGRDGLDPATGLLITPCRSIHTWFMRFPIDAVFLDRTGTVVKIVACLAPWRLAWGGVRARNVLELPAGAAPAVGLRAGDRVVGQSLGPDVVPGPDAGATASRPRRRG